MSFIDAILAVAAKEFRHIRQDRLTLVLTFALPALQLLLYGVILDTRVHNVPAAVVNHDRHQAGRLLAERIVQSQLFQARSDLQDASEIDSAMRTGALRAAIEIPEDYSSSLLYSGKARLKVSVDGVDVATSNYVLAALESMGEVNETSGPHQTFAVDALVKYNPEGRTSVFFLPGLLAVLIQTITTLLLIFSITSERERGTLEQLLAAKLRPDAILCGKCMATGVVGLLECAVLVVLMRSLFHIAIEGSLMLFAAILPLFVLAPLGIGLMIVALARNQIQALQFAQVVFLPSIMLSGFVFPREFLNSRIGWLSDMLPTTYLVSLSRNVVLRGATAAEAAPDILLSGTFAIVLLVVGWRLSRSRMTA